MVNLRERIGDLLRRLNEHVYEKEHALALALLSAVAGESIFLLGPPGVAKSMVARRLKLAFRDGKAFEYLMSRFSTPDEIFGPVSIAKLKDENSYQRMTEGYLPEATVAFLDEIWKAGPAIQNTLLTIINEKTYRNGNVAVRVPLKGLVAASNELPAAGQGLEALWDRFLLRLWMTGVKDMGEFDCMISSTDEAEPEIPADLAISDEEYAQWRKQVAGIRIDYVIFEVIHLVKEKIEDHNHRLQNDDSDEEPLYVSDRRWKKIVNLLRTSAFLNGSENIRLSDCLLIADCLWNEVGQMPLVTRMVMEAVQKAASGYLLDLERVENELQSLKDSLNSDSSLREKTDPGLQLIDSYYYQIDKVRLKGQLLMFASDYYALDDAGKLFYLHKDKYKSQCYILKKYDISMRNKMPQNKVLSVRRGRRSVFVNNYEYPLACTSDCLPLPAMEVRREDDLDRRFAQLEEMLGRVDAGCKGWSADEADYCARHFFLDAERRKAMQGMLDTYRSSVDCHRNELNEMKHAYGKEKQEYPSEGTEGELFG